MNIVDKESMHVKISTVHAKASANEDKHKWQVQQVRYAQ